MMSLEKKNKNYLFLPFIMIGHQEAKLGEREGAGSGKVREAGL